jgi:opacity protein-like surface antigen
MRAKLATIALCCAAGSAAAADNGFYLGAGASRSDFDIASALDSKDSGFKLIAGLRLLDSFGVEANYTDHGKAVLPSGIACIALVGVDCPDTSNVSAKTAAAYAVGFLDFPLLDLFGKAGLSTTSSKLRTPNFPAFNDKDSSTDFAWGAGAQAHFGSLGVRAEYEQHRIMGNEKLGSVSLSFVYTIL